PSSVRDVNRSILLNLVRQFQPVSRATLAQYTGIFRSNVSRIVEEMIDDGLLTESPTEAAGRGRAPIHLQLKDSSYYVLGVYIQPLRTRIAFAGLSARILRTWSLATPADPHIFVRELAACIERIREEMALTRKTPIRKLGIAVPGLVHF